MCVGLTKDAMMACIDHVIYEKALEKQGCHIMDFTHKPMKRWVFISPEGINKIKDPEDLISLALDFNNKVIPSKKKKSGK